MYAKLFYFLSLFTSAVSLNTFHYKLHPMVALDVVHSNVVISMFIIHSWGAPICGSFAFVPYTMIQSSYY